MKAILAFDPSYKTTGFAVVEGKRLITHGIITLPESSDSVKYGRLYDDVQSLCRKYNVERGVVEIPPSFSYKRSTNEAGKPLNFSAIQKVSCAAAVIQASLANMSIRVIEVYAHRWKLCFGGNLTKKQMINLAIRTFPELKTVMITDHEAEAVLLGLLNA
jgi:Holliday junction resolvasome RuvABC endonuclease subunit